MKTSGYNLKENMQDLQTFKIVMGSAGNSPVTEKNGDSVCPAKQCKPPKMLISIRGHQ